MKAPHKSIAATLQNIGIRKGWHVSYKGSNSVKLQKEFGNNVVSCFLIRNDEGLYDIQPFTYSYRSKISYFDYSTPENRYARNYLFFISLFRLLHDCGMIDIINNRDTFLQVNSENSRIKDKKSEITAKLKAIICDTKLVKTRKRKVISKIKVA